MTVYLDAIWLLNFGFDFLLLRMTALILKRQVATWRMVIGALLGSMIVVLMFTPLQFVVTNVMVKLIFSVCMILASFGFHRIRTFAENLVVFYITTFAVGGGMFATHYFLRIDHRFANDTIRTLTTGLGDPISWVFVVVGFPLLLYFTKTQFNTVETRKYRYDQLATVTVSIEKDVFVLSGLVDSGNQLHDPITRNPVMIVEVNRLKEIIPEEIVHAMSAIENTQGWPTFSDETKWIERIRVIPFRAVGKKTTLMLAIKPDKAIILHDNKQFETTKFLIGLTKTELSSEGDYTCILHPKMLQGETAAEHVC